MSIIRLRDTPIGQRGEHHIPPANPPIDDGKVTCARCGARIVPRRLRHPIGCPCAAQEGPRCGARICATCNGHVARLMQEKDSAEWLCALAGGSGCTGPEYAEEVIQ